MVVNSLVTSIQSGQQIPRGKPIPVKGIAWDRGTGIDRVEVSTDYGASWHKAKLGKDLGRFSFREFALERADARERRAAGDGARHQQDPARRRSSS